ncbi:bifunctional riboflavin kinase/FAD synthetase [Flavobacterium filum]|uniref:bifunctional riboflavin kinase/FAD synthetase n=1 Tax=Flavobacterium TaxID=237 RepID=UPI000411F3E8|nr:bifunctional riboflavin kinase/FAD synthetase [Flavobacterium filum]
MKTFQSISQFSGQKPTVVTIGTFDGVHIGHRKIISRLIQASENTDFESLVLTFFPHPRMILQDNQELKLLNTIEERTQLLSDCGLQNLVIHPFDHAFSRLTAEEFVQTIIVEQFNCKKMIIGYDHRFGRNRTATIDDLIVYGEKFHFDVEQITAEEIHDVTISSTKIRKALEEGNITLANSYLGYNYLLTGKIKKGKGIGRTINFPTANLVVEESYKLIPKQGVYVIQSIWKDKLVKGIMNIGFNPTVNGEKLSIEVHFFDFDEILYDKKIQIQVIHRLRDEIKFESLEKLKMQIQLDKEKALDYFTSK